MKFINPIVDVRLLRTRWMLTMTLAIAAAFLVVESYAFSNSSASGIGFAVSIGMLAVGGLLLATSRRARQYLSVPARDLRVAAWDAVAILSIAIAAWNIIQSRVFAAGTARWLTFADGLGIAAVALVGLVLHELSTERVVHSLEVVRDEGTPVAHDDVHHAAA